MNKTTLYPLKFKPIAKEKIWGGKKFLTHFKHILNPYSKYGEIWSISDIEGDLSIVENGFLAENELTELIELYMGELVGDSVYNIYGLGFPLLFKFIDASDDLSVQVHPNDELAFQKYQQQGKTEIWYIVDAEPDAGLYIGFKEKLSPERFVQALQEGTLEQLLQFYPVQKGEFYFIPAGTVHAIGKGILLAEIQQASDITYRISDWNRLDDQGNPRELHLREALEAINFEEDDLFKVEYDEFFNETSPVFRSDFFNINLLSFEQPIQKSFIQIDSFIVYMCTEGEVHFFTEDHHERIYAGETILIPASIIELDIVPNGKSKVIEIYL
ncbi:MAG: mannose-6-phosphate isomerase [Bacteroidales bacterium]|jgi:mannose-6-phosphate isomerase|nr:mannose-6-phosphate isomerase [Bacteroidales bacterium]